MKLDFDFDRLMVEITQYGHLVWEDRQKLIPGIIAWVVVFSLTFGASFIGNRYMSGQLSGIMARKAESETIITALANYDAKVTAYRQSLSQAGIRLAGERELEAIHAQLDAAARERKIGPEKIHRSGNGKSIEKAFYIDFQITVKGRHADIVSYVSHLERSPYLTSVNSLRLHTRDNSNVEAAILYRVYYHKGGMVL